ncbi:MAG: VWA domain-containing protein [Myxococcaceae bacterium]
MTGAWRFTLLGYQCGFAQPIYLAMMGVAVLGGGLAFFFALRRRARLKKAVPDRLFTALAPGASPVMPSIQSGFYTLALLCFGFALAQPQCGSHSELTKRRGIDVVVALDASKSMYARDVQPSRLERAKLELSTLLDGLKGDRVAIISFAGDAFIQCPLTSDYEAAKMFLRSVDPEAMPQGGTDIGNALSLAREVFDNADRGSKDKVVILLSDGEDLTGEISDGLKKLDEIGAKVLAVGIGSENGEPIPVLNSRKEVVGYKKDENGNTVLTKLDKAGLVRIAEESGGEFFYQPKSVAMSEVIAVVDKLQKSELESRLTVRYREVFQPFVAVGLFFLLVGFALLPAWRVARRRAAPPPLKNKSASQRRAA